MKRSEVELFEKLHCQIEALHSEIGILSKKRPNDGVNKFKLKVINGILTEINTLLTGPYKPLQDFDSFNEDDVPTNSDVIMVLAQYLNCMEKLRADNVCFDGYNTWFWMIDSRKSEVKTAPPKKLKIR